MVESDGRDAERSPGGKCLPGDLIGISGFDQIRLFPLQRLLNESQIDEGPVTCGVGDQRRLDRVGNAGTLLPALGLLAWNDQHMPVACGLQVGGLLRDITPHPPRERAVELSEIADDHGRLRGN